MAQVQSFLTGNGEQRQTLVVVFLRGGADGLNLVAPLQDDGYYRSRPRIAIARWFGPLHRLVMGTALDPARSWTKTRDLPPIAETTFKEYWRNRQ